MIYHTTVQYSKPQYDDKLILIETVSDNGIAARS